ncbi:hypothetical protein JCM9279_001780 [Rhodotorula babjevae]
MATSAPDWLAGKRDRLLADNVDPTSRQALSRRIDHDLAELDPNAAADLSPPHAHRVALTPIWEEMQRLGRDHDPLNDLLYLADLDREEMEVYRTQYPGRRARVELILSLAAQLYADEPVHGTGREPATAAQRVGVGASTACDDLTGRRVEAGGPVV